jgi:serine/threonine protein kinase
MTPERYQQISQLCDEAEKQRQEFLAQACADDPALQPEVEAMLAYAEKAKLDGFLEDSLGRVATRILASAKDTAMIHKIFGHYELLSVIGKGGMGEVYLAQDTRLPRKAALKLLPAQFTLDQDRLRRFEREAFVMSALNDERIPQIYEIGEQEGTHFIAAEYIEGETLRNHLSQRSLSYNEILSIALQVVEALAVVHGKHIVHRDIKPENIMVRRDGKIKVIDFGIARLTENWTQTIPPDIAVTTEPEIVIGSMYYMSPVQIQGHEVDHRTDFFSFGVVLYEMVTGRRPFEGNAFDVVKAAILQKTPEPLRKYRSDVPPKLQQIVTKALSKNLNDRYQTAWELRADLEAIKLLREEEKETIWKLPTTVVWGSLLAAGLLLGLLLSPLLSKLFSAPPALTNGAVVQITPCAPDPSRFGFEESDEKWGKQKAGDSQAVTAITRSPKKAKFGCHALELSVDLVGEHPNKSKGEAAIDLLNFPPAGVKAPLNLEGAEITVWVFAPRLAAGNPSHPNGLQLFVKDLAGKSLYSGWVNLTDIVESWSPVTLVPGKEPPPSGYMDKGFNPRSLTQIGLKIGSGANSSATYSGPIYLDGVSWR